GGTVTGTGASISGATSIANLERNSQAQAAIARFAAENPNVTDAKTQLYSLVQGESGFGRDMSPGRRYSGYFQMGQEETFAATGQHISGSQLAAMSFDQQLDIYSKWVHHASPNATNLGLFNAASNPRFQTASDDTIVYHAGTAAAQQNASTWGKYSPGGPGGDITVGGIKKYYSRGDPETNRAIAAAGTPAATTAQALVGAPGTGGVTVSPITGGVPAGIGPTVGGTTGIRDDNGKEVDHQTLAGAMAIAKTGNAPAMKQYLAQHGFSLDATACGAIATRFANLSGVKPPPASAVASSWLAWGTRVNPDVIDRAGMELGTLKLVSPVGTYMHVGQPLTPGEQGGHVMTIVPGTYNDKNGSVQVIDQYGVHSENVNKMQVRYAGDPAGTVETPVATASDTGSSGAWPKDAMTEDARKTIDNITAQRDDPGPANIKLNVVHKNAPSDVSVKADGDAFKGHSMEQTNKAPTPAKAPSHEFSGAELAAG
ncbi:MAG TPA: hypothetical protein VHT68_22075, partial [Pseudolabrys sp.]|nr:hypothetical protein [Pseudolabrys sp.]